MNEQTIRQFVAGDKWVKGLISKRGMKYVHDSGQGVIFEARDDVGGNILGESPENDDNFGCDVLVISDCVKESSITKRAHIKGTGYAQVKTNPNSITYNFGDVKAAIVEKIFNVGAARSNDPISSMLVNSQQGGSLESCIFDSIYSQGLTLGINLTNAKATTISKSTFRDMVFSEELGYGGYGILAQGSKGIIVQASHFKASEKSRHALYLSRPNNDHLDLCEDIVINANILDWTSTSNSDDTSKLPFAFRAPKRLVVSSVVSNGGKGGVLLDNEDDYSSDIVINGDILTGVRSSKDVFSAPISIGRQEQSNIIKNVIISSGISEIGLGEGATPSRDVGIIINKVNGAVIADRIIQNTTGVGISIGSCHHIIIDGVLDNPVGNPSNPFINFGGECSKITVGEVRHNRPDINGKDALFGGLENVTDLSVRFPRRARVAFKNGTPTITEDKWSLIQSVDKNENGFVLKFQKHVTQRSAETSHITPVNVYAKAYRGNTSNKTAEVQVAKFDGALENPDSLNGTFELLLTE